MIRTIPYLCRPLLLAVLLLGFGTPKFQAVASGGADLPARILLYHRVGDDRYPSTNVTVDGFRAQLDWLRANGYHVVPTAALEAHLLRGEALPPKPVVLHFDDGFRSVYEGAYPILKARGLPFTIFLSTGAVDRGFEDYITWEQAAEMARNGATFGAHGVEHLRLGTPAQGETAAAHRARIRAELGGSADRLRALGYGGRWVAYPYGEYGPAVLDVARNLGFALGFSQDPGAVGPGADRMRLPRFAVVGKLADLSTFRERAGYEALNLALEEPAAGPLVDATPALYAARVVHPELCEPGSVNLFVSELGRLGATCEPSTGRIVATGGRTLTRRLNRVLVSLRERETGRYALASWLLLLPGGTVP